MTTSITPKASTLVNLLTEQAARLNEKTLYSFLGGRGKLEATCSFAELDRQARAIAVELQARGMQGRCAMLLYPPSLDYIKAFFGCLYAGVIAVPAYPPEPNRPTDRIVAIAKDCDAGVIMTTSMIASMAKLLPNLPIVHEIDWLATDGIDIATGEAWQKPAISSDSIAFLQYTSGSTSTPKGVMVSHGNLLHNEAVIEQAFRHQDDDPVGIGWLPLYHDMGLIGNVIQPLYAGFHMAQMSPYTFLKRPYLWLKAISDLGVTTSGGPNFAYEMCVNKVTDAQMEGVDLSTWNLAFNGAEPVRADTIDRFTARFAQYGFRRSTFYPCYGLAEATLLVTGVNRDQAPLVDAFDAESLADGLAIAPPQFVENATSQRLVSSGLVWGDQTVSIVNPDSLNRCEDGQIGEIWVKGGSVAQGYWKRPDLSAETFQATTTDGDGPYLRTGDLGFMRRGELFVTGRRKDLIIINGRNYYPQDIELTGERAHDAVRPGSIAAFAVEEAGQEQLVVLARVKLAEATPEALADIQTAIRQSVMDQHGIGVAHVHLLTSGRVPKTSSGKIQRFACKKLFLEAQQAAAVAA